ncbi:2-hydroxy-6-oxo-6-phenylhexa-2,4-dienoate hydrolase [Paracoccus haematequi]|uniref:2-hydroxy-6-oxo-6-phenylhexa-2,4-dienoate hydrolase n=1 Tax=Paracoccus haematequi TaxID=2491866 RepID=A0A447IQQ3_9RHOB|nr:alpha/beta hydrolase [Paracoccus haematequi]VDS09832.1 2-hydroxy-6-oxo-6-phenylhexa-2,4-dienoate hydrolase [Paracoccus haematequi]
MIHASAAALVALLWLTPAVAQERADIARNGAVDLAYWIHGPEAGVPIIVINGQGVATRPHNDGLTKALLADGFRVVLFDNRDSGQSTVLSADGSAAYDLSDMAADTIAVLDAAGIDRAHVMGHSLGGMIAQVLAAEYPDRVLSLISVSSTSGEPGLAYGPAMAAMSEPPPNASAPMADQLARFYRIFEGEANRMPDVEVAARVEADMAVQDPNAAERQVAAAIRTGDRRALLRSIEVPALVLHGDDDPWFPLVHAESTAAALGNAPIEVIDGMGHILSDAAAPAVAERIVDFVRDLPTP